MARFFYRNPHPVLYGLRRPALAIGWIGGLTLGLFLHVHTDFYAVSLMRSAVFSPVSIVGSVCIWLVPFLISGVVSDLCGFAALPAIAFFKGLVFSGVSAVIFAGFGPGSWLLWFLLMFTDLICVMCSLFLWLQSAKQGRIPRKCILSVTAVMCVSTFLDYSTISPLIIRIYS